jgi:hypothetical protein
LEVANGMNKDLNLPSEYRLTTVGSDHAVAVQVSTKVEKKWHAEEQTISVQVGPGRPSNPRNPIFDLFALFFVSSTK